MKIFWGLLIAAVVVWGGYTLFSNPAGSPSRSANVASQIGGPVKLGVLLPLTGDAASYGESEQRAIQIAVDEINAAGGIGGEQVELVFEDGKCDPQAGGAATQKLMAVDQVSVIIGGACSGETLAAAKITEPAQVILISPSASSPKVTAAGDFVFRTYPSDALAGKIAAKYSAESLKAKKAALLTERTDYAQGLREVYKTAFTGFGGQVVADETYTTGDADFRTQVLKIKAAKPDVVYVVPQSASPGLAIIKQLRESGVRAYVVTAEVLLDRQTVKDNAAALEGVIGVEPAVDWENNLKAKTFRDAHRAKFGGADPGAFAANAYDATRLVHLAIVESGLNAMKIRDWLYGVKDWDGAIGKLTMDKNGDLVMGENVRKIVKGDVTDLGMVTP